MNLFRAVTNRRGAGEVLAAWEVCSGWCGGAVRKGEGGGRGRTGRRFVFRATNKPTT